MTICLKPTQREQEIVYAFDKQYQQYDMDGVHHTEEFDYNPANSQRHYETIKQNDPSTEINLNIID